MRLPLSQIRTDGGTQARAQLHQGTVLEYARAMQEGHYFPAVAVFYDGSHYWLADGFHRLAASHQAGFRDIEVDLKLGTRRQAILYAVGSNATHGLRRTPADKLHGVKLLLQDEEWGRWSDRAIARQTATSHPFVARVRARFTGNISSERIYTNKHGTQSQMDTSRIGKSHPSRENPQSLQLEPSLWGRLRQCQEQLGAATLEEALAQLLPLPAPLTPTNSKRWLGLDPGLAKVGWAVLEGERGSDELPRLLDSGIVQTAKKRPTSERLWELERDLVLLLREFGPTDLALELPLIGDNPKTTRSVLEAVGVIHLVCYREGKLLPAHLYPSMWKAHLGNGRAGEEEVKATLQVLFELEELPRGSWDALGIAYAAYSGVRVE